MSFKLFYSSKRNWKVPTVSDLSLIFFLFVKNCPFVRLSVCFLPIWLLSEGFPVHQPASTVWDKNDPLAKILFWKFSEPDPPILTHSLMQANETTTNEWYWQFLQDGWWCIACHLTISLSLSPRSLREQLREIVRCNFAASPVATSHPPPFLYIYIL
jgi:hypothetical protein